MFVLEKIKFMDTDFILVWTFGLRSLEHKPFAVPYDVSAQNFSVMIAVYPREQLCNRRELRTY